MTWESSTQNMLRLFTLDTCPVPDTYVLNFCLCQSRYCEVSRFYSTGSGRTWDGWQKKVDCEVKMNTIFHQPPRNQNKANIIKEFNIKNTLGYKNYTSYTTDCSSYI